MDQERLRWKRPYVHEPYSECFLFIIFRGSPVNTQLWSGQGNAAVSTYWLRPSPAGFTPRDSARPHHRTYQPGLTKIRDTVTLFNLLKVIRDTYFQNFRVKKHKFQTHVFQLGVFVVSLSTTSKLRLCPGAFSLMSLEELRTEHLLKIVCDN